MEVKGFVRRRGAQGRFRFKKQVKTFGGDQRFFVTFHHFLVDQAVKDLHVVVVGKESVPHGGRDGKNVARRRGKNFS